MANPRDFLEDKFLDVGVYANALDLYKEDLVELRDQLKIKVSFSVQVCVCISHHAIPLSNVSIN